MNRPRVLLSADMPSVFPCGQVVDSKCGQVLGHLEFRLSRLLKEEGLKIDEPLMLLGTGHQAKLRITLQLRLLRNAERRYA